MSVAKQRYYATVSIGRLWWPFDADDIDELKRLVGNAFRPIEVEWTA